MTKLEKPELRPNLDCRAEFDPELYTASVLGERAADGVTVYSTVFAPPATPGNETPQFLVCSSSTGCISLFHIHDILRANSTAPQPALIFQAHDGDAYTLTFFGQGEGLILLSGGDDGKILGWRWSDLELMVKAAEEGSTKSLPCPPPCLQLCTPQVRGMHGALLPISEVNSIAAATPQGMVVSGGGDGACYLWDVCTQRQVLAMKGHSDYLHCVAVRGSHCQALSGSEDGSARIWDWRSGKCTTVVDVWRGTTVDVGKSSGHVSPWVSCMGLDSSENWAALGCGGRSITVWSLVAGAATTRVPTFAPPQAIALTRDGISAVGAESYLSRWTLHGEPIQRIPCSPVSAFALAVHPSNMVAIGGSTHGVVDVLSELGSCIASFKAR